jgi:hypothetical protein
VRGETGEGLVAPVREIDDARRLNVSPRVRIVRFQNVQAVAVEQEGVFPEQFLELRDGRVAVGKGLDFELIGGSRDLFGSQFHCSSLSVGSLVLSRVLPLRTATPQVVEKWPQLGCWSWGHPGVPRKSLRAARPVNANPPQTFPCKCA